MFILKVKIFVHINVTMILYAMKMLTPTLTKKASALLGWGMTRR